MSKKGFTKTFGAPMMRDLVKKAQALGLAIDFHINSDGHYVVDYMQHGYVAPTVAASCYFIIGMMSTVARPVGDLFTAAWIRR